MREYCEFVAGVRGKREVDLEYEPDSLFGAAREMRQSPTWLDVSQFTDHGPRGSVMRVTRPITSWCNSAAGEFVAR